MFADQPESAGGHESPAAPGSKDSSTPRILLWAGHAPELAEAVRQAGFRPETIRDAAQATATVRVKPPVAMLMEVAARDEGGELRVRRHKTSVLGTTLPLLAVRGADDPPELLQLLEPGLDWVLSPGPRTDELLFAVRCIEKLQQERLTLVHARDMRAEQARMLALLLDFSRVLASTSSWDRLLDHIADAAAELTCCRRMALLLPDADRTHLTVSRSCGIDLDRAGALKIDIARDDSVGWVFRSQQTEVLFAAASGPAGSDGARLCEMLGRPLLSVPLRASDDVVAVLNLASRGGGERFETWELEFVDLLANISGTALAASIAGQAREEAENSIVVALATLAEYRDNETGRHVERVTRFSLMLAEQLQKTPRYRGTIDHDFIANLRRATPLHDIGKVAIPDAILLKPGKLTPDEIEVIRRHAGIGRDAVRAVRQRSSGVQFLKMAEEITGSHHEWWDGNGYPDQLSGEAIPLSARIVALADVYDAVTSKRVYKDAMSHELAAKIMEESSGTQFEPEVVRAFRRRQDDFAKLARELTDEDAVSVRDTASSPKRDAA